MAVHKKSRYEIKLMKAAGNIVALVHQEMRKIIELFISCGITLLMGLLCSFLYVLRKHKEEIWNSVRFEEKI